MSLKFKLKLNMGQPQSFKEILTRPPSAYLPSLRTFLASSAKASANNSFSSRPVAATNAASRGVIVDQARFEMSSQLQQEIVRLKELKKVNPSVRQAEIDFLVAQRRELEEHLANARIRLDAVLVGG